MIANRMGSEDQKWSQSYARQAISDLDVRELLAGASAEKCHRLHYLQMAAEKVCKAHLVATTGYESVRKTHRCFAKVLPTIARYFYAASGDRNRTIAWELPYIRQVAGEIELLAPACTHGNVREDNTEYPWEDGSGSVLTPCTYTFPNLDDQDNRIGRLLKLLRTAAESYAR